MGHIYCELHYHDDSSKQFDDKLCFTFLEGQYDVKNIVYTVFPGRIDQDYAAEIESYLQQCRLLFPGFPKEPWRTMVRQGAVVQTKNYPGSYVQWLLRLLRDISDFPYVVEAATADRSFSELETSFLAGMPPQGKSKLSAALRFLEYQRGNHGLNHPARLVHRAVEIGFCASTLWNLWSLPERLKQSKTRYTTTGSYYDEYSPEGFVLGRGAAIWRPHGATYGKYFDNSRRDVCTPDSAILLEPMIAYFQKKVREAA